MNDAGVDRSVLLPIDWGPDYQGTQPISSVVDKMLALSTSYPGRLVPFGGIDPRRDGAVQLVEEWFERGIRGLKLYPACGWDPTSAAAMDVYRVCAERRAPVLFHTGHPLPILDVELSNPLRLTDVVREFPELPVWLGHAGAPIWWREALEVAEAGPNVRLEMSVWVWDDIDSRTELDFVQKVLEVGANLGYDRLIFGTDHVSGGKIRRPGFLPKVKGIYDRLPEQCAALGRKIADEDLAIIMGGTAAGDMDLTG